MHELCSHQYVILYAGPIVLNKVYSELWPLGLWLKQKCVWVDDVAGSPDMAVLIGAEAILRASWSYLIKHAHINAKTNGQFLPELLNLYWIFLHWKIGGLSIKKFFTNKMHVKGKDKKFCAVSNQDLFIHFY